MMCKKLLSLAMALMLLVGLAVPASAEGSGETPTFPFSDIGDLGSVRYHAAWIIWTVEGQQKLDEYSRYFEDVPEDSPYYDAVYWVAEQRIFNGTSENTFHGELQMTRAQAAAALCNYAEYLGINTEPTLEELPFEDADAGYWYYDYVLWCYENNLVSGIDGQLMPHATNLCTHFYTKDELVDREPTCTEDGFLDGEVCLVCDGMKTCRELIPATGHSLELIESVAATCETDGYDLYHCTVCNEDVQENQTPAFGHAWDNGYVEQLPRGNSDGIRIHTCKICAQQGYTYIDYDSPLAYVNFQDITKGEYYYEPVLWAAQFGITTGMDNTHFGPNKACTRGQVVTFLWRAVGCPEATGDSPFVDVAADTYYHEAVLWAAAYGITTGTDSTHFSPESTVTRGQFVTFLWRLFGCPEPENTSQFTDVDPDQFYAKAVYWAAENGITTGMTETTFQPDSSCVRGQVVTFLYRV